MQYRPLRPYFYKPVAVLGVPLKFWAITLAAIGVSAIALFLLTKSIFGIPSFVFSAFIGLGVAMFFLWVHNKRKRGWLNYAATFYLRKYTGFGNHLLAEKSGRPTTVWLKDSKNGRHPDWMNKL